MHTGGVRITTNFLNYTTINKIDKTKTRDMAIQYFLTNSSFKILTNSSISCITLKATLNSNKETPFKSMRSNNIDLEVKCILLKVFITNPTQSGFVTIPGRGLYNGIELTSISTFENEIKIQQDIYKKSFCSPASIFDGICPAIIFYDKAVNADYINALRNLNSLTQPEQDKLNEILNVINTNNNVPMNISIIYMEMMENYETGDKVFQFDTNKIIMPRDQNELFLLYSVQYEFKRLHSFGYLHGDAHFGNIMINKNYQYFENFVGRVIIIDFGRTTKLTPAQKQNPPIDTYINYIPSNYLLNNSQYNDLRNSRINYINKISPKIQSIFNFNGSLPDLIRNIMSGHITNNDDRYIYNGGKAKIRSNQKIDEILDDKNTKQQQKYMINSMEQKKFFSTKISNSNSAEMDANVDALFKYLRLESEKVKDTVDLYPITKQIENIDVNEFTDIIRHQLVTNDDSKTKSNKTKSNKTKSNKTKITNKNKKTNKTKSNATNTKLF